MEKQYILAIALMVMAIAPTAYSVVQVTLSNPYYIGTELFNCTPYLLPPHYTNSSTAHLIVFTYLNFAGLNNTIYIEYYSYSPLYHTFLSPSQFDSMFSPPSSVDSELSSIASSNGLSVIMTSPSMFVANGTAQEVTNAINSILSAINANQSWTQWVLVGECNPVGDFFTKPITISGIRVEPNGTTASIEKKVAPIIPPLESINPGSTSYKSIVSVNGKPVAIEMRSQGASVRSFLGSPQEFRFSFPIEMYFPQGMQLLYNVTPLLANGYNGSGITMGIVDAFGDPACNASGAALTPYTNQITRDADIFSTAFSLPNVSLTSIYPMGTPTITPLNAYLACGWGGESVLDVEWSHSIAPGAKIVFGVSPDSGDDLFATVEYMVNNGLANFISLSWGEPEDAMDPFYALAYHEIFLQAAAEGIGVFASSGDSGAYEDVIGYPYQSALYPSVDPMVTGVGGTSNYIFPWNGHEFTFAWNFYDFGVPPFFGDTIFWGSGGGYSIFYAMPLYQYLYAFGGPMGLMEGYRFFERSSFLPFIWGYLFNGGPVPTEGLPWYRSVEYFLEPGLYSAVGARGYPDLSADANPITGVPIVINGSFSPFIWGGTSLASPLTMAMMSVWQSYINGKGINYKIGQAAPVMYQLWYMLGRNAFTGNHPIFINVQYGFNGANSATGWMVRPYEWNPVTGIGSLNVGNLAYYGTPLLK
ncbi:MAG: S53 family peptidase [Thermocladium sp.]